MKFKVGDTIIFHHKIMTEEERIFLSKDIFKISSIEIDPYRIYYNMKRISDECETKWTKDYIEEKFISYTSIIRENKLNSLGI